MIATTENFVPQRELFDLVLKHGALTAKEIGARLDISASTAWSYARVGQQASWLHRDEFGRYAPWCPWPRPVL
jgi:hypothetical protein